MVALTQTGKHKRWWRRCLMGQQSHLLMKFLSCYEGTQQNRISSEDEVWPFKGKANDIVAFLLQLIDRDTHLRFWEGGSKRNNRTMIWQASTEERDLVVGFRNSFPHGARRWASSIPRRISLHRKWLSQLNLSISGEAWRSAERKIISHKQCSISSITLQPFFAASCKVSAFSESARRPNSETSRAWCAKGIHVWVWATRKEFSDLHEHFRARWVGSLTNATGFSHPVDTTRTVGIFSSQHSIFVALGPFRHWGRHYFTDDGTTFKTRPWKRWPHRREYGGHEWGRREGCISKRMSLINKRDAFVTRSQKAAREDVRRRQ